MSELSWRATKRLVHERAKSCCEYCQACEYNIGQPMHIEHIEPNVGNSLDNFCLSCSSCNLSKATAITARDPITKEITLLLIRASKSGLTILSGSKEACFSEENPCRQSYD